eukprot:TRINITY_DN3310_c0_g1_i2.p1 TRINITY_DN3310_c0_g1~~TRINITY_DN3310_c0_g1_i2.p1  ORF type:complete len:320 (+),score=89.75 TRINITY_DN3310_c0_g1_i2:149-1108(+)
MLQRVFHKLAKNASAELFSKSKAAFSARSGPYNPYRYKEHLVPRGFPKNEELYEYLRSLQSIPAPPVRNMRHINPVRESGPLPAYDGPYTMEDIRRTMWQSSVGRDFCYVTVDVEEIMRRVPGITRREAEHITKLGLNPDEQVDYAYIAYNLGIDVFYLTNQCFTVRQVVTNSKGEKVEVLWNSQAYEDLAMLNVGFAPIMESIDQHWELFLWADPPIHPLVDFDLSVPNTWFEYEQEWWGENVMLEDQMNLPEDIRAYPTPRNPHARKELWKSQDDLQEMINMTEESWYPQNTKFNVYRQQNFIKPKEVIQNNDPPQI